MIFRVVEEGGFKELTVGQGIKHRVKLKQDEVKSLNKEDDINLNYGRKYFY